MVSQDGFSIETQAIEESLVQMAAFVEELIARALHAMTHGDDRLADEVRATDHIVDDFRGKVRKRVIQVIEQWSPVGPSLRKMVAYLLISDELERMGDYAVHIARSVYAEYRTLPLELVGGISELARLVRQQVRDGIMSLAMADDEAARRVCLRDSAIDIQYREVFGALQSYMTKDPETIPTTTQLLFTVHDMERIADRIANICEDVIYIVTGTHEKLN